MGFKKVLPVLVAAATMSSLPALMQTRPLAAADTDPGMIVLDALLPDEQLTYDENGNAYYVEGDEVATGKFSLKPNFLLGTDIMNQQNHPYIGSYAPWSCTFCYAGIYGEQIRSLRKENLMVGDISE